ncbi:sigma-70 family RNA polymerase sigma factor [Mitsuaria sp. GD03876]|uniref:RNA polymerase sigma factor n=1 Tax=Mitsuaria sp. GD03876 TaxID=2975399 RepID=UPI00244941E4|nr:sigma-70 family RNA polymerase sigma factor [Mitsuaria sp. GD03876]MDH0863801.1 sigma-70 family RNA polymerase sigma factor [Mitsuaria sp. GD03876]
MPDTSSTHDPTAGATPASEAVDPARQDALYREAAQRHGPDIARFVAGYEREPARRQELLQDVHVALWQSLAGFRGQCSLRTWAYRVAHNVGASHVERSRKVAERGYLDLDDAEVEAIVSPDAGIESAERRIDLQRLFALIHRLKPTDREVMLLYLEDLDAAAIGEITGLSARNVATKVHRIKAVLAQQLRFREPQR